MHARLENADRRWIERFVDCGEACVGVLLHVIVDGRCGVEASVFCFRKCFLNTRLHEPWSLEG